ncbi:DUF5979 domain-containing protein [Microbacterium sp. M28]|uniref:DUF5979 domain-containing protein n=1 Tax=Microbacterium sp. M28 TaxID=2962064 RepID=UPI0021F3FBC8|nr:DUF5979 domain-containing protein [Microbacterium sp. M28]UYO95717.1 DUF5979 domain-containing protein [Microbacterium sp. M28]
MRTTKAHGWRRRMAAGLTAVVLGFSTALVGIAPAAFAADGDVEVDKTASVDTVAPGESFSYTITVSCTSITTGCVNAVLDDVVPSEFEVLDAAVGTGLQGDVTIDGQSVHVDFTMPILAGGQGLPGGTTGTVTIQVRLPENAPYELNGIPITNTATTNADTQTSGPLSDSDEVTPVIPLELDPVVTKTMDPPSAVAAAGTPVTATVTTENASNAQLDQMVITDPADPTAPGNPFETLPFTGLGTVTYPEGAEQAQVEVWNGTEWVAGPVATAPDQPTTPESVPNDDVLGVRITFTDTDGSRIPVGASGGAEIGMEQPEDVGELGDVTVTNTVDGAISRDGTTENATASATHQIVAEDIEIATTKAFEPAEVAAGDTSTATITSTNNSAFALPEMTVTEPALTGDDPSAGGFDESMQFAGFAGPVTYPAGATGATITYYYADGSTEGPTAFDDGASPPAPAGDPVRFQITFTGEISPGAQLSIPFDVQTDEDQAGYPATITNVATTTGVGPAGGVVDVDAEADLLVYEKHLETTTTKSIYPGTIIDRPGEWVLVTLNGSVDPFPQSTTDATEIVVQEPATVPFGVDGSFWDLFDATEITETAVPANATLTINYWNGEDWVPLLDADGEPVVVEGPTVFSMDIPASEQDDILGLQFVYTAEDGTSFPPGTTLAPHFTAEIRETEREPATETTAPVDVQNCGVTDASGAEGLQATPSADSVGCAQVHLDPFDPDEGPDVLDKAIDPNIVTSRSGAEVTSRLQWSTGGYSGIDQVVIQDEATPPSTDPASLAGSFYDAFDLVGVAEITSAMDPYLQYDQITAVQLWDGESWRALSNDPCADTCVGGFPGVTLTDEDRADALGIRLLVEESEDREAASAGDPTAPPVGSGVARSTGNDRTVNLVFELRDERRSDGQPAMGDLDYNFVEDPDDPAVGTVLNVASVTGTTDGEQIIQSDDADTIGIVDVPLNVDITKTWSNSPFGIPPDGTPAEQFPTGRVTLEATNLTATRVDTMSITDPAPGSAQNPFLYFTLDDVISISEPNGAESAEVVLSHDEDGDGAADAGGDTTHTIDEVLAMSSADLLDVVGIVVTYDGRIEPEATGSIQMDLRMREFVRGEPDNRVDDEAGSNESPVTNVAEAAVADAGGGTAENTPTAQDQATVVFEDLSLEVEAGKSFSVPSQTEPDDAPVVMTLTGQPTGSARVQGMQIVDDEATFWNAFDYVGIDPAFALATPINMVKMDVLTGGTFTPSADGTSVDNVGGTWVEGEYRTQADFLAQPLPDGTTADQVQGVRFTFANIVDGEFQQWENPITPLQEVPISVQRRADLRSGGEVPSDRSDLAPAPGETAAGVFSNSTTATACANLQSACEEGEVGVVSDSADAQIAYLHAISAVEITKTPTEGSQFAPGEVIPYELTVTNTGAWPIENPVIVDDPAADGQLMLDPEAGVEGPYAYASTTASMPTDPSDVTVADADGTWTFTFPEGSQIEPGQSYTITIDMVIVPGVPGGTQIANTATVGGDRPFDTCNEAAGPVDECSTDTFITVLAAGAVRSAKAVRAVDDELGAFDTGSGEACEPNVPAEFDPADEGFYALSCIPIAKPGGELEWRFAIANTGNIPMDRIVLTDRLPVPGDTGVLSELARGSEWIPVFAEGVELVQAPAGATMSYEVTTGAVCADDLADTLAPACAEGDWVDPGSVDPADVTGIQLTIELPTPLEPLGVILADFATLAAPYAPGEGPVLVKENPIAWNTVATGAHLTADQSSGSDDMVPTEGVRVGAALATGSLTVEKTVSGDGAAFAPETFSVQLMCVSAEGTPVETELPPIDLTLSAGEAQTIDGLPWGASCELLEGDNGQVSASGTGGVVTDVEPYGTATLDNVYELASLEITKDVTTDAVDQNGEAVPYGPFEVTVVCTFLGEEVFAEGYGPDAPMVIEISDGETVELTGLPAGAECTVSETDTAGAVTVTTTGSTADGAVPDGDAAGITVVLTPDEDGAATNESGVENAFGVGQLQVLKVLEPADSPFAGGPYVVAVECVLGEVTTWSGELVFDAEADDPATPDDDTDLEAVVENIAAGSVCTLAETDDGVATGSEISPNPVTIPLGDTVTATVTNTFAEGSATVTKELAGDIQWADSSFDVSLTCIDTDGVTLIVDIPGGADRTLDEAGDFTTTYDPLPAGALCILQETDAGSAASTQILDANGEPVGFWRVQAGVELEFTVVNTFEVGSIEVTKTTSGDGAELWGTGEFAANLQCTAVIDGVEVPIDIPGGADRTLQVTDDPTTATTVYDGLPMGADCQVTETDAAGASAATITPDDGAVTVGGPEEPVEVTIDNTFDIGEIVVSKEITGDGARWATGEFEITLSCTWNGESIEIPGGAVRTLSTATELATTYSDLPDGAECQVTETDAANASAVTITPDDGAVVVEPGASVAVEVENRYDVGSIVVDKIVTGAGADLGGDTTFRVSLSCEWMLQGELVSLDIPGTAIRLLSERNDYRTVYEGLPNGAECTLTETYDGGAGTTTLVPQDGMVTVEENAEVRIEVVNHFDAGSLELLKVIEGPGAEYFGGGPFTLNVVCVLDDGTADGRIVYENDVILGTEDGMDATIDGIPTGSVCTVTETDDSVADAQAIEGSPATIGDGDTVTVTATNTFLAGSVAVTKTVTGDGAADRGTGPFEVTVQCIDPANGRELVDIPGGAVRELNAQNDYRTEYEVLPAGALCGIAETEDGGADSKQLYDESGEEIGLIELASGSRLGFFIVRADVERSFELVNTFDGEPPLPATGMDPWATLGIVALGLLLLGGGAFLVIAVRRRS